ncbi:MAG: hypothetical protein LBF85_03525, partial [Tannerella sp.]|nr:hypothetical protein [Tannerella sp.]
MEIMQQKKQNGNDGALIAGILAKYISRWMWFVASVAVCLGVGALFLLSRDVQYKVSLHAMLNEEKSLPAATDAQWEAPGIRSTVNSL